MDNLTTRIAQKFGLNKKQISIKYKKYDILEKNDGNKILVRETNQKSEIKFLLHKFEPHNSGIKTLILIHGLRGYIKIFPSKKLIEFKIPKHNIEKILIEKIEEIINC